MAFDIFDKFTQLSDGAAPYTATGIAQVAAANQILDLGATPSRSDLGIAGVFPQEWFQVIIDVSAINIANTNDNYLIWLLASQTSNGANPVVLGGMSLGYGTTNPNGTHSANGILDGSGSDSITGRYMMLATTNAAAIDKRLGYEFVYLYNVIAGTSPSITYTARLVPLTHNMGVC